MSNPTDINELLSAIEDPMAMLWGLVAHAPMALAVFAADGALVLRNQALLDLFGDQIQGPYNVLEDEVVAKQGLRELLLRAFAGETVHIPARWHVPRSAAVRRPRIATEQTAFPLRDKEGRVVYTALCVKDVTAEMLLAEERESLRQYRELLHTALRAARAMAWSIDLASKQIDTVDDGRDAEDQSLWTQQRMTLLHPDDRALVAEGMRKAFAGLEAPSYTYRMRRTDTGEVRHMESRGTFIHDAQGKPVRAVGLAIDVTQRVLAEELRLRAAELERQNERIREASRHKTGYIASMSHELRTPLNAIIGFAQLLADGEVDPSSPQHGEFLADIVASGQHLLRLLNDVLDLAKIEAGKIDLQPEPVSPAELAAQVCSALRGLAANKQIELELDADAALTGVWLDPARFKQVLYNYLSNALKFTEAGGRVSVRVKAEDDEMLRVEVEDTGVGIAPSDLARLFVEFEQAGNAAPQRLTGTGLGLALTRRIVEAQDGKVGVRSVYNKGSVFYALLPRRPRSPGRAPPGGLASGVQGSGG